MGQFVGLAIVAVELADEGDDVVLDVVLALEHVELDPVPDGAAQEGELVGLADEVLDDAMLAGHYKTAVFEEWQALYDPILGLVALVIVPLLGREEAVLVGQPQVLAEQAADLRLGSNPEVANYYALLILL